MALHVHSISAAGCDVCSRHSSNVCILSMQVGEEKMFLRMKGYVNQGVFVFVQPVWSGTERRRRLASAAAAKSGTRFGKLMLTTAHASRCGFLPGFSVNSCLACGSMPQPGMSLLEVCTLLQQRVPPQETTSSVFAAEGSPKWHRHCC